MASNSRVVSRTTRTRRQASDSTVGPIGVGAFALVAVSLLSLGVGASPLGIHLSPFPGSRAQTDVYTFHLGCSNGISRHGLWNATSGIDRLNVSSSSRACKGTTLQNDTAEAEVFPVVTVPLRGVPNGASQFITGFSFNWSSHAEISTSNRCGYTAGVIYSIESCVIMASTILRVYAQLEDQTNQTVVALNSSTIVDNFTEVYLERGCNGIYCVYSNATFSPSNIWNNGSAYPYFAMTLPYTLVSTHKYDLQTDVEAFASTSYVATNCTGWTSASAAANVNLWNSPHDWSLIYYYVA